MAVYKQDLFPRAQKIFTETRFANNQPPVPQRSYGRFSAWDKDDPPNLNFNKTQSKDISFRSKPVPRKPGIISRFFDWIFDYQPPVEKAVLDEKLDEKFERVHEKDASENIKPKLADDIEVVKKQTETRGHNTN